MFQQSFETVKGKSPIPLLLLTAEQWEVFQPIGSCLVSLQDVERGAKNKFLCPSYNTLQTSAHFDETTMGAIVLDVNSIDRSTLGRDHPYLGASDTWMKDGKALLACWNSLYSSRLSRRVSTLERFPEDFMKKSLTIKNNLVGCKAGSHHGAVGNETGYGSRASHPKLSDNPNLSSISQYAVKGSKTKSYSTRLLENANQDGKVVTVCHSRSFT
jgi:hypothetical protein